MTSDGWLGGRGGVARHFRKSWQEKYHSIHKSSKGWEVGVDLLNIDKCFYFVQKHWEIKKTNINLKEKRKSSECLLLLTIFDDYFIDFYWLFNFSFRHIQMKCLSFPLFIFFLGGGSVKWYMYVYTFLFLRYNEIKSPF